MFFTRMALNGARRGAGRLLASPQLMHAAVLASFPPRPEGEASEGRVLWRVDVDGPHRWLYVLSPERPDLTAVVEQAGWPLAGTWETKPYDSLLDRVRLGGEYRFALVANPVRDVRVGQRRSKRLPHVTVAQQEQWLREKSVRAGFELLATDREVLDAAGAVRVDRVEELAVSERRDRVFRRGDGKVTLRTARFDGLLRVTDADAFRRVLCSGIGPAKGYGCGLLTVQRIAADA
ncbi:type I-E CRISPR-associated protein Cas6/Cse3/CasE [Pseudoclavibacter chungangensis]|uniref:Type I-E CRISPR-associated protein Cas6/Cse3/CasE n=2 Tax=Pseudoclavibacter chungangensis TaxID=587635 RepID=A0A7J5C299_9MICO|nr:type I-E CRISPR-associated protein Cas6/Cse3/CasE [Pseudoclavibacter chungangensis]